MEYPKYSPPDELSQAVWAAHILSYMNPHTNTSAPDEAVLPAALPAKPDPDDIDDDDDDDDVEVLDDNSGLQDTASLDAELLTAHDDTIREKMLNCVAELLAHTKGGSLVTAATLREQEESVEIDLARNNGFKPNDEAYLSSLAKFLAMQSQDIRHDDALGYSHSFAEQTITYSANRVDYWVEKINKRLKGSPYYPLDHSQLLGQAKEHTCLLGCCDEKQAPFYEAVESLFLALLSFDVAESAALTPQETNDRRRQIVKNASIATGSPQDTQLLLEYMSPSLDTARILKEFRAIARPITNLRITSRIAQILPNFQSVTFIRLPPSGAVQLRREQVPTIQKAWKKLHLPVTPGEGIPSSLVSKGAKFRKACGRALPSHCEMQLLMHYETHRHLTPTFNYFGCSKKACFLCSEFLAISPLKPRVRGRHGTCHPLWAVHPPSWGTISYRLIELREILKHRITLLLEPGHRPPPAPIEQSSVVSDLSPVDIFELRRQTAIREKVEMENHERRVKMQVLLDPRSVGPQTILYADMNSLCVMCQWARAKDCTRCHAAWYCSKRCQAIDWPAHKLLCSRFLKFAKARPSEEHRLGIWFPRDVEKPKLVWVPFETDEENQHYPVFDSFLGQHHGVLYTLPVQANKRRGLDLDHCLTIYYRDWDETTNRSIRRAVEACPGLTVPTTMFGDYVVLNGQPGAPGHTFGDATLADFRHALDFWSTYYDDGVRGRPAGAADVLAVKVACPLEQALLGHDALTLVAVDRDFPGFDDDTDAACPVAARLGCRLRVCAVEHSAELQRHAQSLRDGGGDDGLRNPCVEALRWGLGPPGARPARPERRAEGCFLLMREDRDHISLEWTRILCEYCVEVLAPLFEKVLAGAVSPESAQSQVTPEKMEEWAAARPSQYQKPQPSPQRGIVAMIDSRGSRGWNGVYTG